MRHPGHPCYAVLWIWCALICTCPAQPTNAPANNLPLLTTARQVRELSSKEANRSYPVRIHGVITCSEANWDLWFIQDEAGDSVYAYNPQAGTPLKLGQTVEMEGQTREGNFANIIVNSTLKSSEKRLKPRPSHPDFKRLSSGMEDGSYIQIQGRVRSVVPTEKGTYMTLWMDSNIVSCVLMNPPSTNLDYLIDSQAQITGVCAVHGSNRKMSGFRIFVSEPNQIVVEKAASSNPWDTPLTHLAALERLNKSEMARRVRVMGRIIGKQRTVSLTIQDSTGTAVLNCQQTMDVKNGDMVEAIGFPKQSHDEVEVEDTEFRLSKSTNDPLSKSIGLVFSPNPPLLTQIDQIRRLLPEDYNRSYPVQIEGVVTVCDTSWKLLFINDDSGGLFVDGNTPGVTLQSGQKVRVKGFTAAGNFSPIISDPKFEVLGPADLPAAQTITYAQAITGQEDAQWTRIIGVVHQVRYETGHVEITLAARGELFKAYIEMPNPIDLPTNMVNARVAITGACATRFNVNRQLVGVLFYLPDIRHIRILDAGPQNPYADPVVSINRLMRFNPDNKPEQRIRIQGVVTLRMNQNSIHIQDNAGGIQVTTTDQSDIQVGDQVDVVGFVSLGQYQPRMDEALLRKIGPGKIPKAPELDFEQVTKGEWGGWRITLKGHLLLTQAGGTLLSINNNGHLFEVRLPGSGNGKLERELLVGSYLQVTGVCKILADAFRESTGFTVLVNTPEDIVLLKRPPWWTTRHTLQMAGILLTAILASAGWVQLLRRRVARQTGIIRLQYEEAAVLERRFRAFVETANDAIIMTDAKTGLILDINRKAEALLGLPAIQLVGKPYSLCHPPEQKAHYDKFLEQLKTSGSLVTPAELFSSKNEQNIPVEVSATTFEYRGQTVIQGIYRDTSDRMRLEEQLRQSQKMQSIGQLAAGIAHDFNNMLTVIQGHVSLLLAQPSLDANAVESTNEIKNATQRAADLTRQLLAFSRKQMLQPQPVNLNNSIHNMVKMLRRMLGEHIHLQSKCSPELRHVFADPGMMEQIIMNLAVNSRDAMPKGGELVLSTAMVSIHADQCKSRAEARAGDFVQLTVSDTGCGMDAATQSRIFEPFYTTKEVGKGTGLGLATVHGIIKQHNGWIEVESEPGKGSAFKIFLPSMEKEEIADVPAPDSKIKGCTETILIVENEMPARLLARTILRRQGYKIIEAASAAEAMRIWPQHRDFVSLVLTEIVMPDGMLGTELARRFCEEKSELQIIYTSFAGIEAADAGLKLHDGCNFIKKPFTPSNLSRTVRNCLDQKQIAKALP